MGSIIARSRQTGIESVAVAQQLIQVIEGIGDLGGGLFTRDVGARRAPADLVLLVLVVVAVDTQQLPIATVGRVVGMIVILVMDGQLLKSFARELPAAAAADMGEKLQRALTIARTALNNVAPQLSAELRLAVWIGLSAGGAHAGTL